MHILWRRHGSDKGLTYVHCSLAAFWFCFCLIKAWKNLWRILFVKSGWVCKIRMSLSRGLEELEIFQEGESSNQTCLFKMVSSLSRMHKWHLCIEVSTLMGM